MAKCGSEQTGHHLLDIIPIEGGHVTDRPCIVAVGAHAADIEFTSGATLLKHALAGWDAHAVHLTLGEKGSAKLSELEYGAQKRSEAEAAAAILRVTPHFLPYRDGELALSDTVAGDLAGLFRRLRPQVIITHWRDSIQSDHIATHELTRRAFVMAGNRHFNLGGAPRAPWARTYFAENWEDPGGFRPYTYVDISEVFEAWEQAFKCYAIGRGEGGYPYWDRYQSQTRIRGIEVGTAYAQAFGVDESSMMQQRALL